MKNTKLVAILKTLDKEELRDLKKYLASPFFNNRPITLALLECLLPYIKSDRTFPAKKEVHNKLFGAKPFKDEKIRLTMSYLTKGIESFLIYQVQQSSKIQQEIILAAIYRKKKLDKFFQSTYDNASALQDKQQVQTSNYFFLKYQLELEKYKFQYLQSNRKADNLQTISDALDGAFTILKLQQACLAMAHQAVFQQDYQYGLLDAVVNHSDTELLQEKPVLAAYFYCYKALKEIDVDENFSALKNILFNQFHYFPIQELRELFLLAINICIRKTNKGNLQYQRELFDLYKKGLENKILINDGIISRFAYQNIVAIGLKLGAFDWVENFLIQYQPLLDKSFQKSIFHFNKGMLAYHKGQYDDALELLLTVQVSEDVLTNLFARTLLLKIYYEKKEFKLLGSFLDAFSIFLRRKNTIGYHRNNYRNIINLAKNLIQLNPYDKEAKKQLIIKIQDTKPLSEKAWFLKQLES